uniref:MARVEL domain-containing protein n=1 Tax=Globodera pallida TaxID=36090 RepID=A0A183C5E9_GLOPA
MDDKSAANNNQSVATNNQSVAINKSQATTCCGSNSNEISAINKYKYGPNNNKSGETCCCGSVSIGTGTYVAAIVVCVDYIAWAIFFFYHLKIAFFGMFILVFAFACLLVIYGQKECNPYVFVPYLIVGVIDMICRALFLYVFFGCVFLTPVHWEYGPSYLLCVCFLGYYAVSFPLYVWFYSIIVRGFLAVKEVESRRYRPYF